MVQATPLTATSHGSISTYRKDGSSPSDAVDFSVEDSAFLRACAYYLTDGFASHVISQ
jgi:hypothetical protein